MVRRTVLHAAIVALSVSPALADQASTPFATPQRDVDVVYAIPLPGGAPPAGSDAVPASVTQRLRVQAATGRQRVDPPSTGAYMLTDGRSGRTIVVEPSLKLATALPQSGQRTPPPGTRAAGAYRRLDSTVVAGNPCTDWQTRDLAGQISVVCLSEDGILLRIVQGGQVRAEAVRVDRAPQPDNVFAVPAGFRQVQAPATPPGGAPAP